MRCVPYRTEIIPSCFNWLPRGRSEAADEEAAIEFADAAWAAAGRLHVRGADTHASADQPARVSRQAHRASGGDDRASGGLDQRASGGLDQRASGGPAA